MKSELLAQLDVMNLLRVSRVGNLGQLPELFLGEVYILAVASLIELGNGDPALADDVVLHESTEDVLPFVAQLRVHFLDELLVLRDSESHDLGEVGRNRASQSVVQSTSRSLIELRKRS